MTRARASAEMIISISAIASSAARLLLLQKLERRIDDVGLLCRMRLLHFGCLPACLLAAAQIADH